MLIATGMSQLSDPLRGRKPGSFLSTHLQLFWFACLYAGNHELTMIPPTPSKTPGSAPPSLHIWTQSKLSSILNEVEGIRSPRRHASPSVRAGVSQSEGSHCWQTAGLPGSRPRFQMSCGWGEPRKPVLWLSFCLLTCKTWTPVLSTASVTPL